MIFASFNQFNEAVILIGDRSSSVPQVNWPSLPPLVRLVSESPTDLQGALLDKGGIPRPPVATPSNVAFDMMIFINESYLIVQHLFSVTILPVLESVMQTDML